MSEPHKVSEPWSCKKVYLDCAGCPYKNRGCSGEDSFRVWLRGAIREVEQEKQCAEQPSLAPSQVCRQYQIQNCHFCDDMKCGDNLSNGAQLLREAEKARDVAEQKLVCLREALKVVRSLLSGE
jgi:hypothetical protein